MLKGKAIYRVLFIEDCCNRKRTGSDLKKLLLLLIRGLIEAVVHSSSMFQGDEVAKKIALFVCALLADKSSLMFEYLTE